MTPTPVAHVIDTDRQAAADTDHEAAADLLFDPPGTGPEAGIRPWDYAAAGAVLSYTCGRPPADPGAEVQQLLRVIHATGRAHSHEAHALLMPLGVVMLAGEIATRTLHRELTAEHGENPFKPLAAAIAHLWPLPQEHIPTIGPGHPGMALHRWTTGHRPPLHPLARDTAHLLATALSRNGRDGRDGRVSRMRCAARICTAVLRHRGTEGRDELAAVREHVLTTRDTPPPDHTTT
ncbi:hypothetical protein AB0G74_30525 [Streptomyces sp. NPDC020875]|uniref:hypothetical protein n=1 Tax=Streptomyces sp. NPDC020875 TaxID=3154898 RepID=UPI0033CAFF9E